MAVAAGPWEPTVFRWPRQPLQRQLKLRDEVPSMMAPGEPVAAAEEEEEAEGVAPELTSLVVVELLLTAVWVPWFCWLRPALAFRSDAWGNLCYDSFWLEDLLALCLAAAVDSWNSASEVGLAEAASTPGEHSSWALAAEPALDAIAAAEEVVVARSDAWWPDPLPVKLLPDPHVCQ